MADMELLYKLIDDLPRDALDELSRYIYHRQAATVWEVAPENIKAIEKLLTPTHQLTETMSEEEINEVWMRL